MKNSIIRKKIAELRGEFPALNRTIDDIPIAYLDGPGGTQVPQSVIDAVSDYYRNCNANTHGFFKISQDSDRIIEQARKDCAAFLGAESDACISFGANMTSLAFKLVKSFGRMLQPGEEVLITQLDHEANRGPWLTLREQGITVREVRLLQNGRLDYEDFRSKINERTRLVCMGMASNLLGTVNDVEAVRKWTYEYGAWLLVDAVHYAPHFLLDVRASGVDFLLCSAYKFYGPHVGILYSKPDLLNRLQTDCLRTQDQKAPCRIETGTLNHAALAGVSAAVDFIAGTGAGTSKRERIISAMKTIAEVEHDIAQRLYDALSEMNGLTFYGPDFSGPDRSPTLAFTLDGFHPEQVCAFLAERAINAWDGHFYAIRGVEVLGLLERGGLTRLGVSIYNTEEEVTRVVKSLHRLVTRG